MKKKNKETGISMGFFFIILHEAYIYKLKGSSYRNNLVTEKPEWKSKTMLTRNTMFEGKYDKIFAYFESKIAKRYYFRGFLVSPSLSHKLGKNITYVFLRD